jgi:hypothetical protein
MHSQFSMHTSSAVSESDALSVPADPESLSDEEAESDAVSVAVAVALLLSLVVESVGVDTWVVTHFPLRQISPALQSRLDLHSLSLQLHEETMNARAPKRKRCLKIVYCINMVSPYSFPIPLLF